MIRPIASRPALALLCAALPLAAQTVPVNLVTGRCAVDLPLDAGQGFDQQRFLVLNDRTLLFDQAWDTAASRWKLTARTPDATPANASGLTRTRKKWRDGALWLKSGRRILKREPSLGRWVVKAEPALEFVDFEVDMTGRILLVCTADPATQLYRALLEAVEPGGGTAILAPYPDPGCMAWAKKVPPVAAATLQTGYEGVQILEFTVLFNPLSRRLFIFRPMEDRLQEVNLGLPLRAFQDLAEPGPLADDLCWQVLPKDTSEAWVVIKRGETGLTAIPLDLFEGTAGEPQSLPGLSLPVFPDPSGKLRNLPEALKAFEPVKAPAGTPPPPPNPG